MKVKVSTSPTQTESEELDLSLTTRRGSECLIGRSPDSDLVLDSDDVSRLHGKFFSQGGHYYFCDVGSRNGSIVNGKLAEKNQSYVLKNGDIIRIGDFTLMLQEEIESQQAETVVRIINPSVFSKRHNKNESAVQQESQPAINQSSNELVSSQISTGDFEKQETEKEEIVNTSIEVEAKQQTEQVEQSEPTFIQPEDEITPLGTVESPHESNEENVADISHDTEHDIEAPSLTHEHTIVEAHDIVSTENDTENVSSTEHDIEAPSLEHEHTIQAHDVVSTENNTENVAGTEDEEASSPTEAISNDIENVEVDTPSQQVEEKLPETEELEESFIQLAKVLEEKQIVLVGHDSKKAELTELVAEHEEFLSYCLTRTWQTFSDDLYKQTGLSVTQEIPPASSGGYQAINSLVNSGEILAVIFLRDLMAPQPGQASEEALLRICNINNVLLATNLPTAQAVLHYLKNLKD